MNARTQLGSSGDRVRVRIFLFPGASGVGGESGALDPKLQGPGREPGGSPRCGAKRAFPSVWI